MGICRMLKPKHFKSKESYHARQEGVKNTT